MDSLTYGSVCSGIEAASVAWEPLGWKPAWFSEIEPFPSAVLAHHWPEVPNLGDMTKHKEWPDAAIDVLVGGTPCQSFSVAGLRKGMADPRGNLALTYLAIADQYRPRWLVWENVPGVLSSNGGRDFGSFLGGLGKLGYGFAYRVLDAQYFGVAQRRRRVFVVGCLGDWRSAAAVLFERDSLSGNPPPSREAGQEPAANAGSRVKSPSHWEGGPHSTLNQSHNTGGIGASNQELFSQRGAGIVGQAIAIHPHCIGRAATAGPQGKEYLEDGAAYTCDAQGVSQAVACTVALRGREGGATAELGGEVATALRASTGGGDKPHVLTVHGTQDPCVSDSTAFALGRNNGGENAVYAFAENSRAELRLEGGDGSRTGALSTGDGKAGQGTPTIATGLAVRRLTPLECEKLQGFPPGHTLIPTAKRNWHRELEEMRAYFQSTHQDVSDEELIRLAADGPRYKAIGNSMAVPCMSWLGRRIEEVAALCSSAKSAS